jgi:peptidyl-prolyl cis-trans isomerase SDCCAG10
MSQVYSTEPQTSGRVILETTHGPLEIQLWCRECPATTKFFLQLCQDGFYDKMAFHRIVPNFLIQTGALRQDGKDQQHGMGASEKNSEAYRLKVNADEALSRRQYELNSRIRFNHRGQVAMALELDDNNDSAMLQPQFFITLDEASFLDGKHICFGTVNGPTIFNALRIGKTDVDEDTNQPIELVEAPRIERIRIMENPIHTDIVPTQTIPWKMPKDDGTKTAKKKKKRKGIKNVNVLSFGDEFEEGVPSGGGMKSSHDLIESKTLGKDVDEELKQATVRDDKKSKKEKRKIEGSDSDVDDIAGDSMNKSRENTPSPKEERLESITSKISASISSKRNISTISKGRNGEADDANQERPKEKKLSLVEARRAKYAKRGSRTKRMREEDTMTKLMAFQKKVVKQIGGDDDQTAKNPDVGYHGQILESNNENDIGVADWMVTKFNCRKHMDTDAKHIGGDGRNAMEDYEVIEGKVGSKKKDHKQHRKHRR